MMTPGGPAEPFTPTYNPFAEDANDHLHADWQRMRAERIGRNALGVVTAVRYEDVLAVASDPETFSSRSPFPATVPDAVAGDLPTGFGFAHPALINNDPPAHTRIRKLALKAFSPRVIAAREAEIRLLVDELLDPIAPRGEMEFQHEFAMPLPVTVISRVLGLADVPTQTVKDWTDGAFQLGTPFIDDDLRERRAREQVQMFRTIERRIEERRADPVDDMISHLATATADDEVPLTTREIIAIVSQLLIAGNETTTNLLGNLLYLLLSDRSRWEALRADRSFIPHALDEAARLASPVPALVRTTTRDTEVGGCPIDAGELVIVAFGSANRDETTFEDAADWKPGREEARDAVSFGRGIHHCIGNPLAKLEIRVALDALLTRFPDLDLAVPPEALQRMSGVHYGLETLPLRWSV